jgi:hypothetical protein
MGRPMATHLATPFSALAQQLWRAAALQNDGDAGVSEPARWVERTNGTEISAGAAPAKAS